MTRSGRIPNFLYIGMPKAGSTWIFEMLRQHPDVFVPPAKDIQYFDHNYDRGRDWYLNFFAGANGETAIGELSHDYYSIPEAADRIHRDVPDIRLICCLREPGDFAISAFKYSRMHSLDGSVGFAGYTEDTLLKGYLRYLDNLRPFFERFPADRIKVLFYEDLLSAPETFLSTLYGFLGVRHDFRPSGYDQRVNATRPPRWTGLTHLAYSTALMMRGIGLANLVGASKRNRLMQKLLYRDAEDVVAIDQHELAALRTRCREQFGALETLIGRRLPEAWHEAR